MANFADTRERNVEGKKLSTIYMYNTEKRSAILNVKWNWSNVFHKKGQDSSKENIDLNSQQRLNYLGMAIETLMVSGGTLASFLISSHSEK